MNFLDHRFTALEKVAVGGISILMGVNLFPKMDLASDIAGTIVTATVALLLFLGIDLIKNDRFRR